MIKIRPLTDIRTAFDFYHTHSVRACSEGDGLSPLGLMPVSVGTIAQWFFGEGRVTLGAYDGEALVGLVSGHSSSFRRAGFLSYLCVAPSHGHRGIATRLCRLLEEALRARPEVERMEIVFHNEVHLPWYIPGEKGAYHPCLPGVDVSSELYGFLKKHGWRDFAIQNCYYRSMADYEDKPEVVQAKRRLLEEGIRLTLYHPTRHRGLAELFDNIGNPGWKAQVLTHLELPIVVAVDERAEDLVVGYTGPLSVVGTPGRGNFCGIGVRTEYRGRGIGKPVFCEMCARHRAAGADFMSLYTGEDNPARRIYEAAGFRVVGRFSDMRKECR